MLLDRLYESCLSALLLVRVEVGFGGIRAGSSGQLVWIHFGFEAGAAIRDVEGRSPDSSRHHGDRRNGLPPHPVTSCSALVHRCWYMDGMVGTFRELDASARKSGDVCGRRE